MMRESKEEEEEEDNIIISTFQGVAKRAVVESFE